MALWGMPGGYEWLIIVAVIVLLFVPGVIVFSTGFFMGRRAGQRDARDEDVSAEEREAEAVEPEVLQSSGDEGRTGGDADA